MISTPSGPKPIEEIKHGELVLTRGGARRAVSLGQTGVKQTYTLTFSNGSILRCTGNHPIWTENSGFVRADALSYGDICVQELKQKKLNSTASRLEDTQTLRTQISETISGAIREITLVASDAFIVKFGSFIMAPFRLAITFITKMKI